VRTNVLLLKKERKGDGLDSPNSVISAARIFIFWKKIKVVFQKRFFFVRNKINQRLYEKSARSPARGRVLRFAFRSKHHHLVRARLSVEI
jgi:hypothetical protein